MIGAVNAFRFRLYGHAVQLQKPHQQHWMFNRLFTVHHRLILQVHNMQLLDYFPPFVHVRVRVFYECFQLQ